MGYHVDTMWSTLGGTLGGTLWSTLGGTLWRPRNPRGYPQNPWILERDSRETRKRETTPKAWIPKEREE